MLQFDNFQKNGFAEGDRRRDASASNGTSGTSDATPSPAVQEGFPMSHSVNPDSIDVAVKNTVDCQNDRPSRRSFWGKEQSVRPPLPPTSHDHSGALSSTASRHQNQNDDSVRSLASSLLELPRLQDPSEQESLWRELDATFLDACPPNKPAVQHILKLCFSGLCVVFRETKLNSNDDKHPFVYSRIPSIPAMAARMLWSELLGGIECHKEDGEEYYHAMTRLSRMKKMEEDEDEDTIPSASTATQCDPAVTMEEVEAFVQHVNDSARAPTSPFGSMSSFLSKFSSSRALGMSSSSSEFSASISTGGARRRHTFMVPETQPPVRSLNKSGWFSFRNNGSSPGGASFRLSNSSTLSSVSQGNMSMSELQAQERQRRPQGKELLLYCVRDYLVETGFVEIAGRRVDDDNDDDNESIDITESEDDEYDGDDSDHSENDDDFALDFSAWRHPQKTRKPQRTQYIQIYKDMEHMYGIHLAATPTNEGGFAMAASDDEDEIDSHDDASRELGTMKRWDEIMAQACLRQLLLDAILTDPEAMVCGRDQNSYSDSVKAQNAVDAAEGSDRELEGVNLEVVVCDDEGREPLPDREAIRAERWKKLRSVNPFRDVTTYALRSYPTHLMRSGQVVEAARHLMSKSFFLARVCTVGPSEAVQMQISNLKELKRRCDLAVKGLHDLGGDGDCIDPEDIEFAAIQVIVGTLDERFDMPPSDNRRIRRIEGEHDDGDIGRAYHQVASLLVEKADPKHAMASFASAVAYKIASLGCNHVSVARTFRHKGHLHMYEHEYDLSVHCYAEAARIERAQDEVDHKKIILSLNSIAVIHGLRQELDKAVDNYSQSLVIQKAHMGEAHPQVAETLNSLGTIYRMMGNYDKAVSCHKEALAIKTSGSGVVREDVADVYFNLGLAHYKRGDNEASVAAYQETLRIHQELVGEDHKEVSRVLYHLGIVFEEMEDLAEAARHYEESLRLRRQVMGDNNEDVARTLHNLGLVYFASGDSNRALESFEDALRLGREQFSPTGKVADTLHAMGMLFHKTADFEKAIECYTEAVEIRCRELGANHIEVASTLHNKGDVYYMIGELDQAMECYEDAYQTRLAELGDDDVDVAATLNNMGVVYMKRNDHEQAMHCFASALNVRESKLGPDHEKVSDTLHNMGLVHKNLNQYPDAIVRYEQALQIRRRQAHGDHDIKVADTLYNMAIVYANTEEFKSALERYKEALRTYRETGMTDDHPSIVNTLQWIKWAEKKLHKLGKRQQTL